MQQDIIRSLWRQILGLAILGILIIISIVPFVFNESTVKEATLVAQNTAKQYSRLRNYYTKNVVSKLTAAGLVSASSDYKDKINSIPLPATMIHELSELSKSSGLQINLYSAYPFPARANRVLDAFQKQAWKQLNLKPNEPFVAIEKIAGRSIVRVAIADLLTQQACVDCHNTHPLTPKVGWKLGDVRGVLEVNVPIDQQLSWQQSGSYQLSVIFIVVFSVFFYILLRLLSNESKHQVNALMTPLKNQKFAMNAHSLVSMSDKQGNITYVNDKFSEVSGYSKAELIGRKHKILNSQNQSESYWQEMHRTVLAGNIWHDEVRNRAKDGHYYWVDTTIVPNFDKNNKVNGFTSIRTDITQKKKDARLLTVAKERAELSTAELLDAKIQAEADASDLLKAKIQAESAKFALDQHSLVSMTDLKGTILYVNDKFIQISGYAEHELLGQKHRLLNSNNQSKSYWQEMHKTVLAGDVWCDEVRNKTKDGQYYWVDTTIVPNFNAEKQVDGFTSIRTDVTEQKENLAKLVIAKELAEVASHSKADFLANMSHEIRTPMNGVIGMTNLLLETELSVDQHKLANTVKSSAVGLLSIINDILDFSKVEAGKLDLELIPFNLGQMVEDVGTTMSFQSGRKNLQLICPATPIIQQWVKADPGRIRQILTNLIGNAIKFTEEGEVAVFVQLVEQSAEQRLYRFEIRDTGIGIGDEQQQHLFDKFTQADSSTTRKYGGTGLGLSICKQLVELMGGDIGINSEVGKGSTFWFTLPLLRAEALTDTPIYNSNIKNEKVLIVDDNETNRDLMQQLHSLWEVPHTVVDSAKAAMAELARAAQEFRPYTIAILDMHMPDTTGLDLCLQIQADPQLAATKLIMASSQAQRGDAVKMKAAGFKGYITKPIHQSELFDVLLLVSDLKKSAPEFITRYSSKEQAIFKAHVLVVEDNPTNQLVIEGLLRVLGVTVDLAGNGEEAIVALQGLSTHELVFMDCQMPILDGYEATQKIRSEPLGIKNSAIPIIAMTANAMAGDRQKCLDAGMDDYLSKPIEPKKVIDMLTKWLPKKTKVASEAAIELEPEVSQNKTEGDKVIFDYEDMASRLMNDAELMKSVAEIFAVDLVEQLDKLKVSVKENQAKQAGAIMHQIKGASANVGGIALSALALKLEQAGKAGNLKEIEENITQLEIEFNRLKVAMEQALL
ncbi:MAG: response regulator [Oceanospirillaceae bacterium]|nr:response regulator [Oceanospirillaceae bacterium]